MFSKWSIRMSGVGAALAVMGAMVSSQAEGEAKGDAAKGKEKYDLLCASCHGPDGDGKGIAAAALDPKPRDFNDKARMDSLSDEHIHKVIKEGGPSVGLSPFMTPWGALLTDEDINNVTAYIRSFSAE